MYKQLDAMEEDWGKMQNLIWDELQNLIWEEILKERAMTQEKENTKR